MTGTWTREEVMADVAARARERHARSVRAVHAQEGEPILRTLARVAYLIACVLVAGPVLLEIVRVVPGRWGWPAYALALVVIMRFQVLGYKRWFQTPAGAPRAKR